MSEARLFSSTDSVTVTRARVQIPAFGLWWADVDAQSDVAFVIGDRVTLSLADVDLRGTVVSGGASHGIAAYRVVAGAGGWSTSVTARAYRDSSGVPAATVIADAASAVGETMGVTSSARLGEHYARSAGPASRVLHSLAPRAWYVDLAGVTQVGSRASAAYTGDAARVLMSPSARYVDLVGDALEGLIPGVVVDGAAPASDVEYTLDAKRLTVRVYSCPLPAQELDALRRLIDSIDPHRLYRGAYEYRVVSQSGDALDLQPVRSSAGLPDLESVPVRLAPGVKASHLPGSLVTVVFLDADPSRPRVITGDDAGAPGWLPTDVTLDADTSVTVGASATSTDLGPSPRFGVARLGDTVQAGPFAGVVTSGSTSVKAGA